MVMAALALVLAALAIPRESWALTADGALMTNSAWATFSGSAGKDVWYRTSYLASASVLVCNPIVAFVKTATPSMAAPSNTVTFTMCAVNSSITTSAFNLVLTDRLPDNMAYIPPVSYMPAAGVFTATYATVLTGTWTAGEPGVGANNVPLAPAAYYLRWVANVTGPGKSSCVYYRVTVL